jgi:hypothetical protein
MEALPAFLVEAFGSHENDPADPVERIGFPAPMAEGVVLDPAADLVDAPVGQGDDVEAVRHQGRVGDTGGEGVPVSSERVDRGHRDLIPPRLGSPLEPVGHDFPGAALDNVHQAAPVNVDHPGHIGGVPPGAGVGECRLVHPQRGRRPGAGRVVDQRPAVAFYHGHRGGPADPVNCPGSTGGSDLARETELCQRHGSMTRRLVIGR